MAGLFHNLLLYPSFLRVEDMTAFPVFSDCSARDSDPSFVQDFAYLIIAERVLFIFVVDNTAYLRLDLLCSDIIYTAAAKHVFHKVVAVFKFKGFIR